MIFFTDMFIRFGIIALVAILGRISDAQETCVTTSGAQGNCVGITQCASLLNVLRQSQNLPASETGNLKKSFCGLEGTTPKVCCPSGKEVTAPTRGGETDAAPNPPDVTRHPNVGLINDPVCGPVTESKILFGNKTKVFEFPWMALLNYKINKVREDFQCGGSLITKRYVLTAAHCVVGLKAGYELHGVRLGEHDLSTEQDCDIVKGVKTVCAPKYQDFLIESYHPHSAYRRTSFKDDIALIRLDRDADLTALNVKPICLPVGDLATLTFAKVIVTGWGRTETGYATQDLLKVTLEIAARDKCDRVWRESNGIEVTHKQICAGGNTRMDSCAGDSGGPLQYPEVIDNVPKYIQYGLVSFGTTQCGVIGYPGVYTSVPFYMDWILDTITK